MIAVVAQCTTEKKTKPYTINHNTVADRARTLGTVTQEIIFQFSIHVFLYRIYMMSVSLTLINKMHRSILLNIWSKSTCAVCIGIYIYIQITLSSSLSRSWFLKLYKNQTFVDSVQY